MAVLPGARCANHPAVAAVEICQRCGNFVCGDCLEIQEGQALCPPCFERKKEAGPASARATVSVVLGALGINCGLVWGIPGLILAHQELAAIERGDSPPGGKYLAKAGKILGWINVALIG